MSPAIKENYARNIFNLNKILNKTIKIKRSEILDIISNEINLENDTSLLDVGTTSSLEDHENQIVKFFYKKINISCLSNLELDNLKDSYKDINTFVGDGRNMKFQDNKFDIVTSNATIEHVGSSENQIKFIRECVRVCKKKTLITTPNRFHPLEFHTRLPFIHFFPKRIHRNILKMFGEKFLSTEDNLNLISKSDLIKFCKILNIKNYKIKSINLLGFKSNFILIISKS